MKKNNFGFDKGFNEFEITITTLENEKEVEIQCNKLKELYYYPLKKENRRIIGELLKDDFRIHNLINEKIKKKDRNIYNAINKKYKKEIAISTNGSIKDYIKLLEGCGYNAYYKNCFGNKVFRLEKEK